MKLRVRQPAFVLVWLAVSVPALSEQIGPQPDGGSVVSTRQMIHPAGKSVEFSGRPMDLILSPDGKFLYAKDNRGMVVIDAVAWKMVQQIPGPGGGASPHGMAISRDGSKVYMTTAKNLLCEATPSAGGTVTWTRNIALAGPDDSKANSCPCGIALAVDEKTAYVCLSRNNSLGIVDMEAGKLLKEIPVGVAPYDVALSADGSIAYVSNWGGRRPVEGQRHADSSGTDTMVDDRGVAVSGTLSVVDLKLGQETTQVETGLHPADVTLSPDGGLIYVANANSDTVSVIDARENKVTETIAVRPDPSLPFGSASNALVLSGDGKTLYVANGGNNAVAVVALRAGQRGRSAIKGFVPTAWYPGGVVTDGQYLYIANVKGLGERFRAPEAKAWKIHSPLGSLTKVEIPPPGTLKKYTAQVHADSRVPQMLRALEKSTTGKKPVPVPEKLGEPSVFEHVVYVIKENKTYDQVLGDIGKGNSDPSLCVFGREATPNQHALAEEFVLLDNYYCNGVCSADGHAWVTQGDATDYLEKAFGGWTRSYPFAGNDCLSYCSSGLIWDNVLGHGLSFRNYGEMNRTSLPPGTGWPANYKDYLDKTRTVRFEHRINIEPLRRYSCRDYPGWNLEIPDVLRAEIFLKEFREYEKSGDWLDFMTVYLPVDHTTGGRLGMPTPRAQVADNDLALGRIVEAISKSKFWPTTCIFVEEDDPQSGFDHVDGHRSLCQVISPYTKRGAVVSEFYSQTSVLHTMERMLGIPPMNQMDAMATLMTDCFAAKPDLTPFTCRPNQVPLDEMPAKTGLNYGDGSYFAKAPKQDPFAGPDRIDDDKLNRAIWAMAKGPDVAYPAHLAGAHGAGLKALHLTLGRDSDD